MRFFLTVLAILPILIESSVSTDFHRRFLKLLNEKNFAKLSSLISDDFEYVKYGDPRAIVYNKNQYLKQLKTHQYLSQLFSKGKVSSPKFVGTQVSFEISPRGSLRRNHEVVLERRIEGGPVLRKYYNPNTYGI